MSLPLPSRGISPSAPASSSSMSSSSASTITPSSHFNPNFNFAQSQKQYHQSQSQSQAEAQAQTQARSKTQPPTSSSISNFNGPYSPSNSYPNNLNLRINTDTSYTQALAGPGASRFRSNSALSPRPSPSSLSPINTNVGMHNASRSLGSSLSNPNLPGSASGGHGGYAGGDSGLSSGGSGKNERNDVAAAVRGLRGISDHLETSPGGGPLPISPGAPNLLTAPVNPLLRRIQRPGQSSGTGTGSGRGPGISVSASASGSSSNSRTGRSREREDPNPGETTLRRINEALGGSSDEGDTLDLSRQDIRKINDEAVEMFRTGVGKGKKGVWRLALSYNSLRDASIVDSFGRLSRLRYLNLKGNYLTQFPPALTEMTALEILDLSKNRITSFPEEPGRLTQLKVLSLTNNKIYTLPGYLVDFASLKVFKVDQNPIEWPPKEVLGPLCASDTPSSRSKLSEAASLASSRNKKDEDLRPWIENMKSWMRQRATESEQLILQAEESNRMSDEELPLSAASNTTSASAASFRSRSDFEPPTIAPSSQETIKRAAAAPVPPTQDVLGQPKLEAAAEPQNESTDISAPTPAPALPQTPIRAYPSNQNIRNKTFSDEALSSSMSPSTGDTPNQMQSQSRPRHTREASTSSFTSPPSASTISSTHSRTPSDNLPPPPTMPAATQGHTRGASYTATQRLSGNLTAKKSLPDLRQSHAQIIQDRRNDGQPIEESRPLGLGIAAPGVAKFQLPGKPGWNGDMIRSPTGPLISSQDRTRIMSRKGSADMLRRVSGDASAELLEKRNSQEGPQLDESRNSYFRRLSTLPVSTISKAIPPALLKFIDAIRGILYALSQLHSALRQYLVFAVNEKIASVLSRVMDPASNYMNTLINALDRFDSMSRRNTPPIHAIRSVIDAAKESVAVFAKVVAVLRMQIPALKANDVRYTRTLLTMIYASMAEVVCSWQSMAPLIQEIRPLLAVDTNSALLRSLGGQKMVPTGSLTGRTPISPIIERRESQSPASVSRSTVGNSPLAAQVDQSPAPLPVDTGTGGVVTSMRTMGRSRRQAGSFSSQDVERGMLMGSPGGPRSAELAQENITPGSYLRHKPSESANISLDQTEETEDNEERDDADERDEDEERESFTPAPPAFPINTISPNGTPSTVPGTPPDYPSHHAQPIAMVPTTSQHSRRGHHHPSSSSGSSHALSMTTGLPIVNHGGSAGRKLSVDVRPPTPASASVFDEDLLDVIETATDIAFTCWLKLAEDVGASTPPFSDSNSNHHKSASQSSTSSNHFAQPSGAPDNASKRPSTISAKHHSELLHLLSVAEQITAALRESLMGLRANPMTYPTTTLPDDAQAFIKTVVQVSGLVKTISAAHNFPMHVRQACSRLTQATRECAILIQVSSLRPGNATPAPIPAAPVSAGINGSSRPMSPMYSSTGVRSQEDLGLPHGHGHGFGQMQQPHSAGWNAHHITGGGGSSGGWDGIISSSSGGGGGGGGGAQKEGLRGLQLPSRQMALSRSRSANAVPQPAFQPMTPANGTGGRNGDEYGYGQGQGQGHVRRGDQGSQGGGTPLGYVRDRDGDRDREPPKSAQPGQVNF
ncbi:hypothetical protein IAU59_006021 [Kwoniella sp. CBS 9459]